MTQASLRESIGVVTQDVSLLHRSVGDNIRYGRPNASREEVEHAARLAEADGFIANLKDSEGRVGYDAFVGDRGVKLSGGQRQRVAIARVLLKDAPILVLDEATSALDSEAEAAVQDKLALLMEGKTVIAIAHRLSTIAVWTGSSCSIKATSSRKARRRCCSNETGSTLVYGSGRREATLPIRSRRREPTLRLPQLHAARNRERVGVESAKRLFR